MALLASTSGTPSAGTSISIPTPEQAAPGTLLVLHLAVRGDASIAYPSGWSVESVVSAPGTSGSTLLRSIVLLRVVTDQEPTTHAVGFTASTSVTWNLLVCDAVDGGVILDATPVSATANGASSVSAPATSSSAHDQLVLTFVAGTGSGAWTMPQHVGQVATQSRSGLPGGLSLNTAVGLQVVSSGSVASGSITTTSSVSAVAQRVVLHRAAGRGTLNHTLGCPYACSYQILETATNEIRLFGTFVADSSGRLQSSSADMSGGSSSQQVRLVIAECGVVGGEDRPTRILGAGAAVTIGANQSRSDVSLPVPDVSLIVGRRYAIGLWYGSTGNARLHSEWRLGTRWSMNTSFSSTNAPPATFSQNGSSTNMPKLTVTYAVDVHDPAPSGYSRLTPSKVSDTTFVANPDAGPHRWRGDTPQIPGVDLALYYNRYDWNNLESSQGTYTFGAIRTDCLNARNRGEKYALRVRSRIENWIVPSYLSGLNWNSQFFRERHQALHQALRDYLIAQGLIGDVVFVDIDGPGNYGEWAGGDYSTYSSEIKADVIGRVVSVWQSQAPNIKLFMFMNPADMWPLSLNVNGYELIGFRTDSWGAEGTTFQAWAKQQQAVRYAYARAAEQGRWIGGEQDASLGSWTPRTMLLSCWYLRPNTVSEGNYKGNNYSSFGTQGQADYREAYRMLGYRFAVEYADIPTSIPLGQSRRWTIAFSNRNRSIPVWRDWTVVLQLRNGSNAVVWSTELGADVRSLVTTQAGRQHLRTKAVTVSGIAAGTYTLELKITSGSEAPKKLANTGRTSDGAYPLGSVTVTSAPGGGGTTYLRAYRAVVATEPARMRTALRRARARIGTVGRRQTGESGSIIGTNSLRVKHGTLQSPIATGNQTVIGVGFEPKLILFSWNDLKTASNAVGSQGGRGWAHTNGQASAYVAHYADGTETAHRAVTNACVTVINALQTIKAQASFAGTHSDGFILTWTTAPPAGGEFAVSYLALGGDDLTDIASGSFASSTSPVSASLAFEPDAILLLGNDTAIGSSNNQGQIAFGVALSTTNRHTSSTRRARPLDGSSAASGLITTAAFVTARGTSSDAAWDLTAKSSSGFTLTRTSGSRAIHAAWLAIKGVRVARGVITQPTAPGAQTISGLGFRPLAVLIDSGDKAAVDAYSADGKWVSGMSDFFSQSCQWFGVLTGSVGTLGNRTQTFSRIIQSHEPAAGAPTRVADATIGTSTDDGFTLTWNEADSTQRRHGFVAFGPTSTATTTWLRFARATVDTAGRRSVQAATTIRSSIAAVGAALPISVRTAHAVVTATSRMQRALTTARRAVVATVAGRRVQAAARLATRVDAAGRSRRLLPRIYRAVVSAVGRAFQVLNPPSGTVFFRNARAVVGALGTSRRRTGLVRRAVVRTHGRIRRFGWLRLVAAVQASGSVRRIITAVRAARVRVRGSRLALVVQVARGVIRDPGRRTGGSLEPTTQSSSGTVVLVWDRPRLFGATPVDLRGATLTGIITTNLDGTQRPIHGTLTLLTDGADGRFRWQRTATDTAVPGIHSVQFVATFGDGRVLRSARLSWRISRAPTPDA